MNDADRLALEALQARVTAAEAAFAAALNERDTMIRRMRFTGSAGATDIGRVTGLGRRHVYKIVDAGSRGPSPAGRSPRRDRLQA